MIIGVDIGGTKTLVAVFAQNGKLLQEVRFETNRDYDTFLADLKKTAQKLNTHKAKLACAAVPGLLNRSEGIAISLGNLPWKDRHIQHDIAEALGIEQTYIENDSKLAGLAEARYIREQFSRTIYLTFSTGIGGALVINGNLAMEDIDMEIGKMPLLHEEQIVPWEDFASGRAFSEKYNQKAVDVTDDKVWKEFAQYVNQGLGVVCAAYQPEAIIFGGGLGKYIERFKKYLTPYLKDNLHVIVRQPVLVPTHYQDESVIYGCYQYAKDKIA